MSRLLVTGVNSQIVKCLREIVPDGVAVLGLSREQCDMSSVAAVDSCASLIAECRYILVAHGILCRKPFLMRRDEELCQSLMVNMMSVVRMCEIALERNPNARIVVLGSESAMKGSYDIPYWMAKAALHAYVRERRLEHFGQQLVCVAPSMIMGTRMTAQKTPAQVQAAVDATPKHRGLDPAEVAECIRWLLFEHTGYISNTVVEMNGGKFARRNP